MTENLTPELRAHFGEGGLRSLPAAPAGPLRNPGLPLQVGPYFFLAEPSDPLSLGEYAAQRGLDAGPVANQLRIGTDCGAQFYLAPDHSVRAVLLGSDIPELAVNHGIETFAAGLLLLDRYLPTLGDAEAPEAGFAAYRELRQRLLQLDATAFECRESWWPRVLDDLRQPLNVGSSAAFEYSDSNGITHIVTETGAPGLPHPEQLVWNRLRAVGVEPEQVTRVYCELEPCLLPGRYCSLWLAETFPNAEFTHRFDYGETAASREEGIKALMLLAAELHG